MSEKNKSENRLKKLKLQTEIHKSANCEYRYSFYNYPEIINPELEIARFKILDEYKAINTVIPNISNNKNQIDPILPNNLAHMIDTTKYTSCKGAKYNPTKNTIQFKTTSLPISKPLYKQFQTTLIHPIPSKTDLHTLIFCILYRYNYLGMLSMIQLAVQPKYYKNFEKKHNACLELFGSAMNHTLPNFCSLFYDLEKYFGSVGNHFNLVPIKGMYLLNPPFTEDMINGSLTRMLKSLESDKSNELRYLVTIPIWDKSGRKWVNKNCKIKVKMGFGDMPLIKKLEKSDRMKWHKTYCKENYQYLDFLTNRKINAAPTHVFMFI